MSNLIYLSDVEEVSMADEWFKIANEEHFWMKWRFSVIQKMKKHLPEPNEPILEIGCGNGIVINQMEKQMGYKVDGCDLNKYALDLANETKGDLMVYNIFDKDSNMTKKYSMVILLDVIEHIDDHVDFLKAACAHLKPGGKVLVNVPAHNTLFSKYDTVAGHKRRYTKSMLKEAFEGAGIEPLDLRYWGLLLTPVAVVRKGYLAMKKDNIIETGFKPPSEGINKMFGALNSVENALPFKFPFGSSLMGIGKIK